ncbi:hypothetical protein [Bartonella sp. AU55XJBT]|nr:hypothetical protein [Bartonella sp. AU55XJBT]
MNAQWSSQEDDKSERVTDFYSFIVVKNYGDKKNIKILKQTRHEKSA